MTHHNSFKFTDVDTRRKHVPERWSCKSPFPLKSHCPLQQQHLAAQVACRYVLTL